MSSRMVLKAFTYTHEDTYIKLIHKEFPVCLVSGIYLTFRDSEIQCFCAGSFCKTAFTDISDKLLSQEAAFSGLPGQFAVRGRRLKGWGQGSTMGCARE